MLVAALLAMASPAEAPACTLETAVPASVREMARDPDRWLDRCVRLEGYVSANRFFADVAGIYAYSATDNEDRLNDGWLGLYLEERWVPALRRGTVWGVLQDCQRNYERAQAAAGPDTIVMMLGYCHYQGGLNLQSGGFRASGPTALYRQTDEAARRLFGDLIQATPDRGPPPEMVALGDRFIAALRGGDAALLRQLVVPWSESFEAGSEEEREFESFVRGEAGSPLAELRAVREAPPQAHFREKVSLANQEHGDPDQWHVCYCRTADCAGRWPISAVDAVADAERPYVCLRAIGDDSMPDNPDRLAIDRAQSAFLEPEE